MTAGPGPGGHREAQEDECRGEAARLRARFVGWVIIWVGWAGCFRAYRRLPGARRDTALSAPTAAEMAGLISGAERGARPARCRAGRS